MYEFEHTRNVANLERAEECGRHRPCRCRQRCHDPPIFKYFTSDTYGIERTRISGERADLHEHLDHFRRLQPGIQRRTEMYRKLVLTAAERREHSD